ncbi:hypothetical protein GEV33_014529 [Tenebrio molitor]|uniref:Uncharacterized protein n=1 Tax=Tenebrio molitor TaxID=7067 RepID=A0A8J6H6L3_TENMO|nr:hypothetical protein GEV33_014529 [Tenebrio molitor]
MRGADRAGWCLLLVGVAACAGVTSRLPRTSAGQLAAAAAAQNKTAAQLRGNRTFQATIGPPPGRGASSRVSSRDFLVEVKDTTPKSKNLPTRKSPSREEFCGDESPKAAMICRGVIGGVQDEAAMTARAFTNSDKSPV